MDEKYQYLEQEDTIDIKSFIIKNLKHWYLFATFLLITFFIAILVNRFSTPVYKVSTWILISEKQDPLELENRIVPSLYGNPYKLQNEIGILKLKNNKVRLALQLGTDKKSLIKQINQDKIIDTPLLEIDQKNWVYQ